MNFNVKIDKKPIATYEAAGVTITISRRRGGIGPDDYLVEGTNGFCAIMRDQMRAVDAAQRELAQVEAERGQESV